MIPIIVGTETGTAEYVADEIQTYLQALNINSEVLLTPKISDLLTHNTWIICTSTQGSGELPANLHSFNSSIKDHDLSNIKFVTIALGDSSYDTYCRAGEIISNSLINQHATALTDIFNVDAMDEKLPEELVIDWLKQDPTLFV